MNSKNLTDAVSGVRDMKAPKHFLPDMLSKIIVCSLDRSDDDKEHASTLIHTLRTEGLVSGENFMQVCSLDTLFRQRGLASREEKKISEEGVFQFSKNSF